MNRNRSIISSCACVPRGDRLIGKGEHNAQLRTHLRKSLLSGISSFRINESAFDQIFDASADLHLVDTCYWFSVSDKPRIGVFVNLPWREHHSLAGSYAG